MYGKKASMLMGSGPGVLSYPVCTSLSARVNNSKRLKHCCSFSDDGLKSVSKLPSLGVHPDCAAAPSQGDLSWPSASGVPRGFWAAPAVAEPHHPGLEAK